MLTNISQSLNAIAIVGMACHYADAKSPYQLWENVLSQRRAFRRIPRERLALEDYFNSDRTHPDTIYSKGAAVLEGYEFDRLKFKVVGDTFRGADLAHWLALDIAEKALVDAGFVKGKNLPKETTGVLLGNTLTGEFSRANTLRLRWPYVRRIVEAKLIEESLSDEDRDTFLTDLEANYKKPFPDIGAESLAGNLSNTIAGRICNHFDLKGGGYVLDGACSSSLLAVANACSALAVGDLDVALAGGVDLSIDPFELVGFAKAGALAEGEMRVYDLRSGGFIPGEGCGFVVLMRYEEALAQNCRIYGLIRGWGISSDGQGGITRPEVDGQLLALQRAYRKAGFGADTVAYFEGHGTGTPVGDATELQVLTQIRENKTNNKAVVGSIKANIGHTKAAAGIAGLIKATLALHSQIIPPTSGCETPHPLLTGTNSALQILREGQLWPATQPLRAGVSAMGFGGINTHVVLEGLANVRRTRLTSVESQLIKTPQDAELFLLTAENTDILTEKVAQVLRIAPRLSGAEMGDLATQLAHNVDVNLPVRAAIIARNPQDLTHHLEDLLILKTSESVFLETEPKTPRIGFLFPGQAAPIYLDGGAWVRRFPFLKEVYTQVNFPTEKDLNSTAIAQPAIIASEVVGLQVLDALGITGELAIGHSLGELGALHWAGAFNAVSLLNLAQFRGQIMAQLGNPTGTMASIGASQETVKSLLNGRVVVIAGLNSPSQTVISGEILGVNDVIKKAQIKGIKTVQLPVSHAFHSPLVSEATQPLEDYLNHVEFSPLQKRVVSTVTGSFLSHTENLPALLVQQITSPVRFLEAANLVAQEVDFFIEVGAGKILSGLIRNFLDVPVISLDAGSNSLQGLLKAVGMAFVWGSPINFQALFEDRFTRPFNLNWQPKFLSNPCELAPFLEDSKVNLSRPSIKNTENAVSLPPVTEELEEKTISPLECVRQLVALKTELPLETIKDEHRLLSDLHLNSISVGQLVGQAARRLGLSSPVAPTDYAGATVAQIAEALENLTRIPDNTPIETVPTGVDRWIRTFTVELMDNPLQKTVKLKKSDSFSSNWRIFAPTDYGLIASLQKALNLEKGEGVIVCLPPRRDLANLDLLLEAAKTIIESKNPEKSFVLVQHGDGAASFAKTFSLENPQIKTYVIDFPLCHPQGIEWITSEIALGCQYSEAYYDQQGTRRSPILRLLPMEDRPLNALSLNSQDVLLVTGGGKGIAAECALSLAQETGVHLALLGRSHPSTDSELAHNLSRMKALGIKVVYHSVDVTDAQGVNQAISQIKSQFGTITALIHGAGINRPKLIKHLDKKDFLCTVAPKVQGLENLLRAVNPDALKLLVTFGSIIARTGLPGEGDYGLANEWLGLELEHFKANYPQCRCLNLEWSVWSGVGMGERLGRIDALMQQGITPIPPDEGISILRRLISHSFPHTSIVVTGRFGTPPTLKIEQPELPLLRFLELPQVYYPGVELIVDVELSSNTDPYLKDHIYQGEAIFPGVMGLEAMAQATKILLETSEIPIFEEIQFLRPIVVSVDSSLKVRIAALKRESGQVEIVLRSEQSGFSVDHFRAICYLCDRTESNPVGLFPQKSAETFINPQDHLYGEILFHQGRFQRLQQYHHLRATECIATLNTREEQWFSRYLPQDLILGDPGARDAVIHALQACVPHATLLPVRIDKLIIYSLPSCESCIVAAKERQNIGDTFIYDLDVLTPDGVILEHWEGLTLEIVQHRDPQKPWVDALLPPYLQRQIKQVFPDSDVSLMIDRDATVQRQVRSDRTIKALTSSEVIITRRPDGKPAINGENFVSVAHAGDLTLTVVSSSVVGCDVEPVITRSADSWCDLLGPSKFALASAIASTTGDALDVAATRVWTAHECLKKVGIVINAPLILTQTTADVVWLESGEMAIATLMISIQQQENPLVFAVLIGKPKTMAKYQDKIKVNCEIRQQATGKY